MANTGTALQGDALGRWERRWAGPYRATTQSLIEAKGHCSAHRPEQDEPKGPGGGLETVSLGTGLI
ncbi:hypothetical protein ColLi_04859 [Colletotrichum liriopes]|uniref:Uncharacterized protein n=1 Tax=Colletotrichum liriopes TaxID=708192 RepID=A0AA37GJ89_9PEZI|nr:hypothetical protein ColLi_04859 [Colletotrichum liriopes]